MQYQNLRLYNNSQSDFINLHGGVWTNQLSEIKLELKRITSFWDKFKEKVEDDIISAEYEFPDVIDWYEKLENYLSIISYFPDFHDYSVLMCIKSFSGFNLLPVPSDPTSTFLYNLGTHSPDVQGTLKGKNFSFASKIKKLNIIEKEIDLKEFSLIRISTQTLSDQHFSINLKARNFNKTSFLKDVLSLPEFWRNFHFITRSNSALLNSTHPAYEINKILAQFYNSQRRFGVNYPQKTSKKDIFEHVRINNSFNMSINTFATHLMFRNPGLILPLSVCEQKWAQSQEPAIEITISENEVNLITIPYSDDGYTNRELLQNFSDNYSSRELAFAKHFEIPKYNGGKYLITTAEEFAYIYEANMVEVFDSLSKFDSQHT